MRQLLNPYSEKLQLRGFLKRTEEYPFYPHISPIETREIFQKLDWDFNAYTKFVFVRNPWARLVSLYEHILREDKTDIDFKTWLHTIKPDGDGGMGRNQWQRWKMYGVYSIEHFIKDDVGNVLVDKVIRLEDIAKDLRPFLMGLGLPNARRIKIKYKNQRTNKKHYSQYYDEAAQEYVRELYRYDIVHYGYTFEEPTNLIAYKFRNFFVR